MNRLLLSLFLAAPLIPISTTGMAQSAVRWALDRDDHPREGRLSQEASLCGRG